MARTALLQREALVTAILDIRGVTRRFRGLVALDNVSLTVQSGEIFAIIGPNGAGKTTLFNLVAGDLAPDAGEIHFDGRRIDGLPPERICRAGLARTFQIVRPFPDLTVLDNVAIGAMLHIPRMADARAAARDVLQRLDLADRGGHLARSLTLPDRKRLEVARALATRPKLLLLDEVMAGLRPTETDRIVSLLRDINREHGVTIVLIEHVMRAVVALADRAHVLHHGATIAQGTPAEVIRDPAVIHSYLGTKGVA
jgi:branched-chain amino acid transport system ATP-binding protein